MFRIAFKITFLKRLCCRLTGVVVGLIVKLLTHTGSSCLHLLTGLIKCQTALVGVVILTNIKKSLHVFYLGIDCCDTRSNFQDLLDDDEDGGPHEKDEGLQDQMKSGGCLSFSGRSK